MVADLQIRKARYRATCSGLAGSIRILFWDHCFQHKKAPLYFLTVEGALLLITTAGRNLANSHRSGSCKDASSCQVACMKTSEQVREGIMDVISGFVLCYSYVLNIIS